MDKNLDLIMINQQEEEQLRSQDVPNIILILGIKGKKMASRDVHLSMLKFSSRKWF